MKNKIINFLYKIFSFLADKTNGWKIFVSPKLFFGALVVGGITMSVSSCNKPQPTCYMSEPTCYMVWLVEEEEETDTIYNDKGWWQVCYGMYKENKNKKHYEKQNY